MRVADLLSQRLDFLVVYVCIFIFAYLTAELYYRSNKEKAIAWGEKLDYGRRPLIKLIASQMDKPLGMVRITLLMFIINLFGGALLWSTLGGLLLIVPFIHYALIAFLVNLALKRFPERRHWLVIPNVIFEVGAFMVAAAGSVYMGLSIFGEGSFMLAASQWGILFIKLVIPLQFIGALFESLLLYRIHVVKKHPWPYGIGDKSN